MPITLHAEAADCPIRLNSVLLKPELSDVQFSVFNNNAQPQLFHAHKLLLAFASDVFKAMFFGSVPQENPVVVKDSNPAAFEAFLQFVYTGCTTIADAEAFPLLYLGKKGVTSENVGQIVLDGENHLDDAPPKFWESVESHADALLASDEFLELRKDTVYELVQRELEVVETFIYDKVVSWAKAGRVRNDLPAADGETLRRALEGIIQHIRFPTMTAEEFAQGPAAEAVLTAEEKAQVCGWFSTAVPQSTFPATPRYTPQNYVCKRLTVDNRTGRYVRDISGTTQAIDFSVSRAVRVTGLSACGFCIGFFQAGLDYTIVARLMHGSLVLATKTLTGTTSYNARIIPVDFDQSIKINANKRYTASVVVTGPASIYGHNGAASTTVWTKKGDVVFKLHAVRLLVYFHNRC